MMRVPYELAETLAVVVGEGTLDAAARRLHITPSAVSQRIKTLEEQLGRVVLVRSKPVRLTVRRLLARKSSAPLLSTPTPGRIAARSLCGRTNSAHSPGCRGR